MEKEEVLVGAAALAGGVVVGKNWSKIKKFGVSAIDKTKKLFYKRYKSIRKFVAVQNEHIQDYIAEKKRKKEEVK